MSETFGISDAELLRARLTLLALRGNARRVVPFDGELIQLYPNGQLLRAADVALSLAFLTKPLDCYAEILEGRLGITALSVSESTGWHSQQPELENGSKKVLCVGHDGDWLLVPNDDLALWRREYRCDGGFTGWDSVRGYDVSPEAIAAADADEITGFLDFRDNWSADDLIGEIFVTRLAVRDAACERCRERPAVYDIQWFETPRPARALCQRCIDLELTVDQFDRTRSHERDQRALREAEQTKTPQELEGIAHFYARSWAYTKRPPYIREFIARHRGY